MSIKKFSYSLPNIKVGRTYKDSRVARLIDLNEVIEEVNREITEVTELVESSTPDLKTINGESILGSGDLVVGNDPINPEKFVVDKAYIGREAEGIAKNIYTTINGAGTAAFDRSVITGNRTAVIITPGLYNEAMTLKDKVDFYCMAGTEFKTGFGNAGLSVNSNVFGKGKFTGSGGCSISDAQCNVVFEFDYIDVDGLPIFARGSAVGPSNFHIKGNYVKGNGNGVGFENNFRGPGIVNVTYEVEKFISGWHDVFDFRNNWSGTCTVNCPEIILEDSTIYGGNFASFVKVEGVAAGSKIIFNGNMINKKSTYLGGTSAGIRSWATTSDTLLRVNGNIEAGNTHGVYISHYLTELEINGTVSSKHAPVVLQSGNKFKFTGAIISNTGGSRPVYIDGGTSLDLHNCVIRNNNANGDLIQISSLVPKVRIFNCLAKTDAAGTGVFINATIPATVVQIHNTRANKGLNANVTDQLSPTGLIVDANLETYNY